jgi:hypothetical protein
MMDLVFEIINYFFLTYGMLLLGSYILIAIFSSFELSYYIKKNNHFRYHEISEYKSIPSISILAPCYNEEKSIVDNIRSLLLLNYPGTEVIIINDGSADNSLSLAIARYDLIKVNMAYEEIVPTAHVRAVYKSKIKAYANLIVVDKENGGKADALNAGINIAKNDLFLAIDVDCILERDAIFRMAKPFLEEKSGVKVIASGGVIRVVNSCEVENGQVVKVNFPRNLWARFQVLEYMRAFTFGRLAWSKINGLLIISGAFGMFDRKLAIAAGGYDKSTVGEDLELVVRMRKYMHQVEKKKYKVAFIPDPLCWTEVPQTLKVLSRQRNRWTRGSIDTILKHKDMLFNREFGRIGMISFPYWVIFEWLAPLIEFAGMVYFVVMLTLGLVDTKIFVLLLIMVLITTLVFSIFAVFYETYVFYRYRGFKFLLGVLGTCLLEMPVYHPLNVIFSLKGNYDFFLRKNKKGWGKMTRTGFN